VPFHYVIGTRSLSDIHFPNTLSLRYVSLPVQRMVGQYYSRIWSYQSFAIQIILVNANRLVQIHFPEYPNLQNAKAATSLWETKTRHVKIKCPTEQHKLVQHKLLQHKSVYLKLVQHKMVHHKLVQLKLVQHKSVQHKSVHHKSVHHKSAQHK